MKKQNSKFEIRNIVGLVMTLVVFFSMAPLAMAHVVVKPNEVKVAAFQTFTMGVPNEKEIPTTAIRLVIPDGIKHVSPNVKPGWTVAVKKTGDGEEATVTEITWTNGAIPAGQRDDFFFSAQVPAEAGAINWKAYQTYQDGTVVAWDQDPNAPKPSMAPGDDDDHGMNPYSTTKIVNDLVNPSTTEVAKKMDQDSSNTPMIFSVVALLLSCAAVGLALRKK